MSLVSVKSISKSFKERRVVSDVSFTVQSGTVVGLLGPNGAGKTTSFYMVVGLVKPDQGDIFLNQHSIGNLAMHQRAKLGLSYLPQEASIFRKLTVEQNIAVALESIGVNGNERAERIRALTEEFRIQHILYSYGYALSGGERRRVEIARALATKPEFLLLDEPFAGIDPIAVGEIQQMIGRLRDKGIGVLITDHNVRETLSICDRAYILKEGQIQVEGTPSEISQSEIARKFYLGENFRM